MMSSCDQLRVSWCRSDVICASVESLRSSDAFTDLVLICDRHLHRGHQLMWSQHSSFVRQLCLVHGGDGLDQGRHEVVIIMDQTPNWAIAKWTQLLYTGETVLTIQEDQETFLETGRRLGLSLELEAIPISSSSVSDEANEPANNLDTGAEISNETNNENSDNLINENVDNLINENVDKLIHEKVDNFMEDTLDNELDQIQDDLNTDPNCNDASVPIEIDIGSGAQRDLSINAPPSKSHKCRYCHWICGPKESSLLRHYSESHFLSHLRLEFGHLPACCYCGKTFLDANQLLIHLGVQHCRVKKYLRLCGRCEHDLSCSDCNNRVFESREALVEHLALQHFRVRLSRRFEFRGSCHFCNRPESCENDVLVHMAKQHDALRLVAPRHIREQLEALQEGQAKDDEANLRDGEDLAQHSLTISKGKSGKKSSKGVVKGTKGVFKGNKGGVFKSSKGVLKSNKGLLKSAKGYLKSYNKSVLKTPSKGLLKTSSLKVPELSSWSDFKRDYKLCRVCPKCHLGFASSNSLTRHICMQHLKHEVMQHCLVAKKQCRLCRNTFTDVRALVSHVGKVHGLLETFFKRQIANKSEDVVNEGSSSALDVMTVDESDDDQLVMDLFSPNDQDSFNFISDSEQTEEPMAENQAKDGKTRGPLPTYAPLISLKCPLCPKSDLISRLQVKRHLLATHFNHAFKRLYGRYDKTCCYCGTVSSCLNENLRHVAFTHKKFLRVIPSPMILDMVENGLVSFEEAANFVAKEDLDRLQINKSARNTSKSSKSSTKSNSGPKKGAVKASIKEVSTTDSAEMSSNKLSNNNPSSLPLSRFFVSCPICERRTIRGKMLIHLTFHFRAELRAQYGQIEPFCDICHCDFVNQDGFISHMGCVHGQVMNLLTDQQRDELRAVGFEEDGQIKDNRRRIRKKRQREEDEEDNFYNCDQF